MTDRLTREQVWDTRRLATEPDVIEVALCDDLLDARKERDEALAHLDAIKASREAEAKRNETWEAVSTENHRLREENDKLQRRMCTYLNEMGASAAKAQDECRKLREALEAEKAEHKSDIDLLRDVARQRDRLVNERQKVDAALKGAVASANSWHAAYISALKLLAQESRRVSQLLERLECMRRQRPAVGDWVVAR